MTLADSYRIQTRYLKKAYVISRADYKGDLKK